MKLLFIDEEFPWPLTSGKRIRTYNLLKVLATHHQVHIVCFATDDTWHAGAKALQLENVITVAKTRPTQLRRYIDGVLNLFTHLPYSVTSHHRPAFKRAVQAAYDEIQPDILVVEWTPYARYVPFRAHSQTVIATHNIESRILERHAIVKKGIAARYFRAQARRMKRFEQRAIAQTRAFTAVSADELSEIESWRTQTPGIVIDNGVDLDRFTEGFYTPSPPPKLTFLGSMDWAPNEDAVQYFIEEIWGRIRRVVPNVEMVVIGRSPSTNIRRRAESNGIRVTGTVDDVRPYLRASNVNVVPLRVGGGSRLKILEALACGLPVVSTSVGVEGLKLTHGKHLLIADTAEHFAAATISLLEDQSECRRLIANGRTVVETNYDWRAIGRRYESFLLGLTANPSIPLVE